MRQHSIINAPRIRFDRHADCRAAEFDIVSRVAERRPYLPALSGRLRIAHPTKRYQDYHYIAALVMHCCTIRKGEQAARQEDTAMLGVGNEIDTHIPGIPVYSTSTAVQVPYVRSTRCIIISGGMGERFRQHAINALM